LERPPRVSASRSRQQPPTPAVQPPPPAATPKPVRAEPTQTGEALALFESIPEEASLGRYAPGKWSIREVLDLLLSMTKTKIEVRQDPARLRPSDVPILLGDASLFTSVTGWKPTIPFEQTLRDMLEYWRAR